MRFEQAKVAAPDRIGSAVAAAEDQPRQERLRTALAVEGVLPMVLAHRLGDVRILLRDLGLTIAHGLPECVVDDA